MKRSTFLGLACWLLSSTTGRAGAQTAPLRPPSTVETVFGAGDDEISLVNGGMLRGTVVSAEPGKEAVIFIQGTSEGRHVPWAEVAKVNQGKYATALVPPPPNPPSVLPAPVTPLPIATASADGMPQVHLKTTTTGLTLNEVGTTVAIGGWGLISGTLSHPVCAAPCDRVIDGRKGQSYFLGGPGIHPSSPFQLLEHGRDVSLDVKAGNSARHAGGVVTTVFGAIALGVGAVTLAVGSIGHSYSSSLVSTASPTWTVSPDGTRVLLGPDVHPSL